MHKKRLITALLTILLVVLLFGFAQTAQAAEQEPPIYPEGWQGPSKSFSSPDGFTALISGTDFVFTVNQNGWAILVSRDNDPKWLDCNPQKIEEGHAFWLNNLIDVVPWTETICPADPPDNEWRWKITETSAGDTIEFHNRQDSGTGAVWFKPFPIKGAVTITKIDQNNQPWAGVTVNLYDNTTGELLKTDVTPAVFDNLEYGEYVAEEIAPAGSIPMGPTSVVFTVNAEHLTHSVQFQNMRGPEQPKPHIHAYKYEQTWDEEGYPFTVLYINTKKVIKDDVEKGDGIGRRNEGNFDRTWNVSAEFKQYIVVCTDDGENCRVRVALIMPGLTPEDAIFGGRLGDVTIGKETFKLNAKSEKARDMKICTIPVYKDLGYCP